MTPNNTIYIDIIGHFLDQNKQLCTVLLTMRNMHNDHSGKNQAKAILLVFNKYLLKVKLRYFIMNNASSNDICITEIIDLIRLNLNAKERKLQFIRHIINLIVKVFIFDNKFEFFKIDIAIAESTNDLEIAMKL